MPTQIFKANELPIRISTENSSNAVTILQGHVNL